MIIIIKITTITTITTTSTTTTTNNNNSDNTIIWRELRGSQGMGVVSNSWFVRVLLSSLHMLKPSCRPMFKPPSLGPP